MTGNYQTLPGGGAGIDLSNVENGQLLQLTNGGAITGLNPSSAGPNLSGISAGQLVRRTSLGLDGFDYSALGSNKTITVAANNADQTSIQAAIDAANEGDVVEVLPGIYHEALTLKPGVILLCRSGVVVEYTVNNSTPTISFNGGDWSGLANPFVSRSPVNTDYFNCYNCYVLGEGIFRRTITDAYGNIQFSETPCIKITAANGTSYYHLTIEAREIDSVLQWSQQVSIKADVIKQSVVDAQLLPDILCHQSVKANTITFADCLNGATQDISVDRVLARVSVNGGATATNDPNQAICLKTVQYVNALYIAQDGSSDCCLARDMGTQHVTANGVDSAQNAGGRQYITAGSIRMLGMSPGRSRDSVTFAKASHVFAVLIYDYSTLFLEADYIHASVDVQSGGFARVRANQIGADQTLYNSLHKFDGSIGANPPSQPVKLSNNSGEPSLPASRLEIVGAKIVQGYFVSGYGGYSDLAIMHTAGHLILRDCVVIAAENADYSVYSLHAGVSGSVNDASLRLYGTNLTNKAPFRPVDTNGDVIPPDFGAWTVAATIS